MKNDKLSQTEVDEIYLLLKYTYRSYESIGQQYGVEARAVSQINRGIFHKADNEIYPLREGKIGSAPPKLTYEQVTSIINQLQSTSKSLREIARDFGVDYKDILGIKNGTTKLYRRRGLAYPLRPNN